MKYIVNGGNKLFGKVKVDLAKNAILPIIAATIMCDEKCIIKDIPMYLDVIEMSAILEKLGKSFYEDYYYPSQAKSQKDVKNFVKRFEKTGIKVNLANISNAFVMFCTEFNF